MINPSGPMALLAELQWRAMHRMPLSLLIALLGMILVMGWCLPSLRNKSQASRWLVPALRMVVVLTLAVMILQPVEVRPRDARDPTGILILVDQSESMSALDACRSPANLVRQAAALGWIDQDGILSGRALQPPVPLGDQEGLQAEPDVAREDLPRDESLSGIDSAVEAVALLRWLDRVQVLVENVGRATGEMDYARYVSRGMETAQDRQTRALGALQDALTHVPLSDTTNPDILEQFKLLQAAVNQPINRTWLAEVRQALDRLGQVNEQRRAESEQSLYERDATIRARVSGISDLSRLALVQQAIFGLRSGLITHLPQDLRVGVYGFDSQLHPLNAELMELASGQAMEAQGDRTDLAGAMTEAMRLARQNPLEAVILFSDGRQVGGEGAMSSALGGLDVPVIAVQVAPARSMRDVSVSKLVVPEVLYPGQVLRAHAEITLVGPPPRPGEPAITPTTTVTIQAGSAMLEKQVALNEGSTVGVDFELAVNERGMVPVTVQARAMPGEASDQNNQRRRMVKMLAEGLRIGVFAGASAQAEDPAQRDFLALQESVRQSTWLAGTSGLISGQSPLPMTPEQIGKLDLLVLMHVPVDALSEDQWEAVHRMVSHQGGCLVLVAGSEQWARDLSALKEIGPLLPFAAGDLPTWRIWPGRGNGYGLVPAPESPVHLLQPENPEEDQARWLELPGVRRLMPLVKIRPNAQALLVERDSGMPVVVQSQADEGKVLYIGCDELWRWSLPQGPNMTDRFWRQLMRQAARAPLIARAGDWAMDVSQANANPGEVIQVQVRHVPGASGASWQQWMQSHWGRGEDGQLPASNLPGESLPQLVIRRQGNIQQTITLQPVGEIDSGIFQGSFTASGRGDLQLSLEGISPGPGPEMTVQVMDPHQREMANLAGDDSLLQRVASLSGGSLLGLEDVARLPEKLAELRSARPILIEDQLWDSPGLFIFVMGRLAAEWGLRKHLGMA